MQNHSDNDRGPANAGADPDATQAVEPYADKPSVLVVADDAELTASLQTQLIAAGHRVVRARSALMAREALAEDVFPIIIIDRSLEDDGLQLCAEIRGRRAHAHAYIVLVLAQDSHEHVVGGLRAGADDYLRTQCGTGELHARMNTASRIVRLERESRGARSQHGQDAAPETAAGDHGRRQFVRLLERDVQHALQAGQSLSILILDIDFFKRVNDDYGHVTGDELLRQFANRIRFALPRDQDWLARIGGEEFITVLPGIDGRTAIALAERLRTTVQATPFHVAGADLDITVSIGVGSLATLEAGDERNAQSLLDQADQYLYRSKLAGRNRVSAAPEKVG